MSSYVKDPQEVLSPYSSLELQQVDRSLVTIVAHVFPPSTQGAGFLQRFIERATNAHKSSARSTNMLSLSTRSIATLGQELGFSNDTTHKYVALYTALGVLTKQKMKGHLIFCLSTGPYEPPTILEANLDALIATSRPKLRVLAQEVKERCYVYGLIALEWTQQLRLLQSILQPGQSTPRRKREQKLAEALALTNTLLKRSLIPRPSLSETDRHAFLNMSSQPALMSRREEAPSLPFSPEHPPCHSPLEDNISQKERATSPAQAVVSRRDPEHRGASLPKKATLGDGSSSSPSAASPLVASPGRRGAEHRRASLPKIVHQGDMSSHPSATPSPCLPSSGRRETASSSLRLPQEQEQGDSPIRNVLDICNYIKTYTYREPRRIAEMLAEELEQDRGVYPKYLKLLREPGKAPRDPHIITAAFITTLVRLHRDGWKMMRPGGFFTNRCREYDLAVPQEVEEWITRYGCLSLAEIRQTLAAATPVTSTTNTQSTQGAAMPPFTKPVPKSADSPITLNIHLDHGRVQMSKQEALGIEQMVREDLRTLFLRTQLLRMSREGQPDRYAVLIDGSLLSKRSPQTIAYSRTEWQQRLDSMDTWRDLFGLPALPFAKEA